MSQSIILKKLSALPEEKEIFLTEIYNVFKTAAPEATESIKWGMPTFELNGNLVHFAAFKNHAGIFPTPSAIIKFKEELKKYSTSKGAIQIPYNSKIPKSLLKKIIRFRIAENKKKIAGKSKN